MRWKIDEDKSLASGPKYELLFSIFHLILSIFGTLFVTHIAFYITKIKMVNQLVIGCLNRRKNSIGLHAQRINIRIRNKDHYNSKKKQQPLINERMCTNGYGKRKFILSTNYPIKREPEEIQHERAHPRNGNIEHL